MNKYEQLIEFIINEQEDKARELFHNIVVEKSREIYESLIDESDLDEMGGNNVEDMVDEITTDEEGVAEDEEFGSEEEVEVDGGDEFAADDEGDDFGGDTGGDEFGGDTGGDEPATKGDILDLADDLAAIKAKFDALMGGDDMGADDMGADMGADMGGADMGADMGGDEFGADEGDEELYFEGKADKEDKKDAKKKDAKKMTEAEWIREYVEKVGNGYPGNNSETGEVGNGGTATLNKTSIVAGKNDMGGTASNIAKGGANTDPSSTPSKKASGLLKNGSDLIGKVQNSKGANAGKTSFASKAPAAKSGEQGGTNDKSPLAK